MNSEGAGFIGLRARVETLPFMKQRGGRAWPAGGRFHKKAGSVVAGLENGMREQGG